VALREEGLLEAQGLSVSYRANGTTTEVLTDVTFSVSSGESLAVMGPSGSGKSTLLRVLAGAQPPDHGVVMIKGEAVDAGRGGTVRANAAMVYQDYRLIDFLTVAENLLLAAEVRGRTLGPETVAETLKLVSLEGLEDRFPKTLSGGQQQRAAIARAIAAEVEILIADEPTGALDRENSMAVATLLRDIADQKAVTVVVATHDVAVAGRMHRCLLLKDGRLVDGEAL
jgi:putative ABC transport system ATP-binding protein